MNQHIPLGQAEGQKLEFKSKDALKHLPNVSREVVAMLNSGGGEIWIGLGEEHGRAVRIEALEQPAREINRLRDHLADAIEPCPAAEEINVQPIEADGGDIILRVSVKPGKDRQPYDLREGTGRHFLKRVGDRLRSMGREEIISPQSDINSARRQALEKIQKALERQRRKDVFRLRIQPVAGFELKLEKGFQDYFRDPQRTGNRYAGWNFVDPYKRIEREADSIRFGGEGEPCLRVFRDGAIEFTMPIINLYWKSAVNVASRTEKEIWPYCLLEYPTSVFRLAATVYREHHFKAESFLAALALFGLRGWTLRPYSPVSFGYKLANPKPFESDEIVLDDPVAFSCEQIVQEPDRCAFRLVTQVYWHFGLWEEDLPAEFNQDTGKLVLPDA
jgi:hypothetical protein